MIHIREVPEGIEIAVRAQPGAKRNAVVGTQNGCLKVAVHAPPDKGRANDALVDVLAEAFGLKRSQVSLASGATSREKKFVLAGVTKLTVEAALTRLLGDPT